MLDNRRRNRRLDGDFKLTEKTESSTDSSYNDGIVVKSTILIAHDAQLIQLVAFNSLQNGDNSYSDGFSYTTHTSRKRYVDKIKKG